VPEIIEDNGQMCLVSKYPVKELQKYPSVLNRVHKLFDERGDTIKDVTTAACLVRQAVMERLSSPSPFDEEVFNHLESIIDTDSYDAVAKKFHHDKDSFHNVICRPVARHVSLWYVADIDDHLMGLLGEENISLEKNENEAKSPALNDLMTFFHTAKETLPKLDVPFVEDFNCNLEQQFSFINVKELDGFLTFTFLFGPILIDALLTHCTRSCESTHLSFSDALKDSIKEEFSR
jgi:hypothetical protein